MISVCYIDTAITIRHSGMFLAGIQEFLPYQAYWIPAYAGMTAEYFDDSL